MDHDKARLQQLYELYIRDEASPDEVTEFWDLLKHHGVDSLAQAAFELYGEKNFPQAQRDWDGALNRILGHKPKARIAPMRRWLTAASIALLAGISGYFYLTRELSVTNLPAPEAVAAVVSQDVAAPAGNHATIILSDGSKIYLDSTGSGKLAMQNDVTLFKTEDGKIHYAAAGNDLNKPVVYNTLVNPRGSKVVDLLLSDGSHLWLNAGSSVRFPVAFSGNTRKVVITGEAYFEVAHDVSKKFIVEANDLQTVVLGTHFNVNAYDDEDATRVTLLEGSVQVLSQKGSILIRPGEQAVQTNGKPLRMQRGVDLAGVIAWKNQMFLFHDTNIRNIMNEVSRWYDVDINYQGRTSDFADLNFGGSMSRQKNVSELLKRLEATEAVRFEVNGRRIDVIRLK